MARYKQVDFFCEKQRKHMVCDGHKGPSVLMAIYNCMLLNFGEIDENETPAPYVLEETIKRGLGDLLKVRVQEFLESEHHDPNDMMADQKLLLELIQSLGPDTHVTPCLASIFSFETSNLVGLFYYLGIHLLHGWVVNPVDQSIYESVRHYSYEGLQIYKNSFQGQIQHSSEVTNSAAQKLALIQDLLAAGKKQSTMHGYACLCETLQDGPFVVLYRDNKFNVIHKKNGDLLILETDPDIVSKYSTIRWRILEEVERESIYLTSEYSLARDQPNIATAKEWYRNKISKIVSGETSESEKIVKAGDSKVVSGEASEAEKIVKSGETTSNSGQLTKKQRKRQNKKKKASDKQREDRQTAGSPQTDDFLKFLYEFQDGGSKPYFEGIVEAIKHTGSPNFNVPYDFVMMYDKSLAMTIQDNYPSIIGELTESLGRYLVKHGIHTAANLHILHVPEPKSVQSFSSFVENMEFLEDYDIHGDGVDQSPSYLSRKMALGYLDCIVNKFRENRCFGGNWGEFDMLVRDNGSRFVIECEDMELNPAAGYLDLERFDTVVLQLFESKNRTFPPYFKELRQDFLLIYDCIKEPEKWERFLLLISSPFALKAPMVRSTVICDIFRAAESECSGQQHTYAPLNTRKDISDWRPKATQHWLLKEVYDHKNYSNGPWTSVYTLTKWAVTHWSLLKYSRHFINHVLRYTTIINKGQQIHDLTIVDILLARHLGEFIAQLIRFLIINCDINGLFSSPWRHFTESDCTDKPQQNIAKVEVATTEAEFVSIISPGKLVKHETGYANTEVLRDARAGTSHKSVLIGNLCLIDFMNLLTKHDLQVTATSEEDGEITLHCGDILIYKAYRKIPVDVKGEDYFQFDKEADPSITVVGPLGDDYYKIFEQLSVWLAI